MHRHPIGSILRRSCPAVVLAALLASASAVAGEVYQWKDARGVTHYSQSPPPSGTYQLRAIGSAGQAVSAAPKVVAAENAQCTSARRNLDVLQGGGVVQEDTDGDGKGDRTLDETARNNQRELAQAAIKATCNPVATAP